MACANGPRTPTLKAGSDVLKISSQEGGDAPSVTVVRRVTRAFHLRSVLIAKRGSVLRVYMMELLAAGR